MGRAPCCDKANVKKGPWAPEEDAKLKAYIEEHGTGGNWIALPQKIGLKRCGKSCRLRWLNYLRPNIKHGGFSEEEDNIICNLYISIGSRWSVIAAQLPGRTDNDIKNYWNTRLKKKLLGKRKQSHNNLNNSPSTSTSEDPKETLSNSALERLQLHMQLQGFQNPLSFFTHPQLWPKLHPTQEKIIQSLQTLNDQNPNIGNPVIQNGFQTCSKTTEPGLLQNMSGFFEPQPNISLAENNQVPYFEAVDDFLNDKTESFTAQTDQMGELDCLKEMGGGSKDGLIWWSNNGGYDMKSGSSSNSWDSTSVLQSELIFQDYDLGYNL